MPPCLSGEGVGAFLLIAALFSHCAWAGAPGADPGAPFLPFRPGERLAFQVSWSFIPAGEAVLEVLPWESLDGTPACHFVLTARTSPLVDVFHKVRDRIDAYTDRGVTRSLLYRNVKAGSDKRDITLRFDWKKELVVYSNFDESKPPLPVMPGSFDPLSVFYAFRVQPLVEGTRMELPITDGKKCVMGHVTVVRREKTTVAAGTFDTFLVEPDLEEIGGVFKKTKGAGFQIWVTADTRRIPVKIRSKVMVGSFTAELVKAE